MRKVTEEVNEMGSGEGGGGGVRPWGGGQRVIDFIEGFTLGFRGDGRGGGVAYVIDVITTVMLFVSTHMLG